MPSLPADAPLPLTPPRLLFCAIAIFADYATPRRVFAAMILIDADIRAFTAAAFAARLFRYAALRYAAMPLAPLCYATLIRFLHDYAAVAMIRHYLRHSFTVRVF